MPASLEASTRDLPATAARVLVLDRFDVAAMDRLRETLRVGRPRRAWR
jgi:hypothetical protein